MLSLTSAKSGALIGVLISVTTIPAAANIGVAAALGNWADWRGAMAQLVDQPGRRSSSPASAPCASSAASTSGGGGGIAATTRGSPPACPAHARRRGRRLMARQLAILLGAFAARHGDRRRPRRGQLRRRPRRRPALLRRGAGLGPAARLGAASGEELLGEPQVERRRHLEVLGRRRVDQHPCRRPPRPASPRRWRRRDRSGSPSSAARSASTRKTCGVCAAQSSPRSRVSSTTRPRFRPYRGSMQLDALGSAARLIVSVTGAAAIAPAASGSAVERRDDALDQLRR